MNSPKFKETDYIDFLIAAQILYSCQEAARVQPKEKQPLAHDAVNRSLYRLEPDSEPLWQEAKSHVDLTSGYLVIDDSLITKLFARKMELVNYQWSGRDHRVEPGIGVVSTVWTEGDRVIPVDYCIYDREHDGLTKNDHFRKMLEKASKRGLHPEYVGFDSWYSSLDNLKTVRNLGWHWLGRFHSNRLVNPDRKGNVGIEEISIPEEGRVVHLKGYGMIKVFKTVSRKGDVEYWGTSDLEMDFRQRLKVAEATWMIEVYHREWKQCCGAGKCQARKGRAQLVLLPRS
jgi:hypothetical protein